MAGEMTVGDIAEALLPRAGKAGLARLVEQIRYWTRLDLLRPAGPKHLGSGRWRLYPANTVYQALVLWELSRLGARLPVMEAASRRVDAALAGKDDASDGPNIASAIHGHSAIYLTVYHAGEPPDGDDWRVTLDRKPYATGADGFEETGAVILNLTALFRRLEGE